MTIALVLKVHFQILFHIPKITQALEVHARIMKRMNEIEFTRAIERFSALAVRRVWYAYDTYFIFSIPATQATKSCLLFLR